MSRIKRRTPSDTVFRMAKSVTPGLYLRLKAHNDIYWKNSKQWQYFTYCYNLESWSKEKENKDWEGHNLKSLKYSTLHWLIRLLAIVSDWEGKELHFLLLEFRHALKRGGERLAYEILEEAKEIAWETEELALHRHLLELQRSVLGNEYTEEEKQGLLKLNFGELEKVKAVQDELERMEWLHHQHYGPFKLQHTAHGFADSATIEQLVKALDSVDVTQLRSISAKRIYHMMTTPLFTHLKDFQAALGHGKALMLLYQKHSWLRARHSSEFQSHCRAVATLAEIMREKEFAAKLYQAIITSASEQDGLEIAAIPHLIIAKCHLGIRLEMRSHFLEAKALFDGNKVVVESSANGKDLSWALIWLGVCAIKHDEEEYGLWIFERMFIIKVRLIPYHLVHARLLQVVAMIKVGKDQEMIFQAINAAMKYIQRQEQDFSFQLAFLKAVNTLMKASHAPHRLDSLAHGLSKKLQNIANSFSAQTALFFYNFPGFILQTPNYLKRNR